MVTLVIVLCFSIAMGNSFTKIYLCIMLMLILASAIACSKVTYARCAPLPFINNCSEYREKTSRVKWTWQLPEVVRNTFNNSPYASWFIEKIIRYDNSGSTVFRFSVNNGSLLDSDHYDSFLKTDYLDIADTLTIPFTNK